MDSQEKEEEDIIEKFLKENSQEVRRVPFYKKRQFWVTLRQVAIFIGVCLVIVFLSSLILKACEEDNKTRRAEEHRKAQSAYILVQYTPDGHALNCWVTPSSNSVTAGGQTAGFWLHNWKDYAGFATKLQADPKICQVWNWEGKDP